MIKKVISFSVVFVSLIVLTGCWSRVELNELGLVAGMAIDKTETGYMISVQVYIPSEVSSDKAVTGITSTLYQAEGVDSCEAFRRLTFVMPRRPVLSHALIIVLSEDVAKAGLTDVLDALLRDNELRISTNIVIAKGVKAADIFQVLTPFERTPAAKIDKLLKNAESSYSAVNPISMLEVTNNIVNDGGETVIPGIEIIGDFEKGNDLSNIEKEKVDTALRVTSYAAFKQDKFVGWLDEETSIGYNYIMGKVKAAMIETSCGENQICSLEVRKAKAKAKAKIKDKIPKIEIKVEVGGVVCELICEKEFKEPNDIYKLEKSFEDEFKKQLMDSIKTIQTKFKSDIFSFGSIIHRKEPKLWKKISGDWNKEFENLDIEVIVDVKIDNSGSLYDSIKSGIK